MEAKVYSDNANRNDFLYIDYTYAVPKVRALQLTFLCILTVSYTHLDVYKRQHISKNSLCFYFRFIL